MAFGCQGNAGACHKPPAEGRDGRVRPVLVAYASKYGSTAEVAERVAEALSAKGIVAQAKPASEVRELSEYSAVVLGTAMFFFRLHSDAKRFLSRNKAALRGVPVAVFALGPFHDTPEEIADARRPLDAFLVKNPWLEPVAVTVFGGRLDPERLRFPDNVPMMRALPASDARDWEKIAAWADALVPLLGAGTAAR